MIKIISILAVVLTVLIYFVGTKNIDTYKIGGAFALSGDTSTVAWGEAAKNGAELAVDDINAAGGVNGKKLELVIEDMQSSSKGSISAVTKLVNIDQVDAILVTWLDVYQGAASLAATYGIPIITPDGGIEAINYPEVHKGVFSTWYRTDVKAKKIIEYMKKQGVHRLAGLYQNDSYYTDFAERIEKYAKENGMQIVATEKINEGSTGIRTQVLKIKNSNPDAVMFGLYNEKDIYNFLKIHSQTFPNVSLYGDEIVQDHYNQEKYKGLYEGVVYFHASAPQSDFRERYKNRFNVYPVFGASTSYDAVMILAQTLKEGGGDSYLKSHTFKTVSYGDMTFDEMGGVKTENNQFDLWRVEDNVVIQIK